MNIKKIILMLTVFLLFITVPAFSGGEEPAPANNVVGKVQVLDNGNNDEYAWTEFEAHQGKDNQPAGGFFHWWLEDGSRETYVEAVYVKVDGNYAWFAGKCTKDSADLAGRWLFIAAHDGGMPGRLTDHIWWEWLPDTPDAESIAKAKVENLETPASNKPIISGDIVVHCYE